MYAASMGLPSFIELSSFKTTKPFLVCAAALPSDLSRFAKLLKGKRKRIEIKQGRISSSGLGLCEKRFYRYFDFCFWNFTLDFPFVLIFQTKCQNFFH